MLQNQEEVREIKYFKLKTKACDYDFNKKLHEENISLRDNLVANMPFVEKGLAVPIIGVQ